MANGTRSSRSTQKVKIAQAKSCEKTKKIVEKESKSLDGFATTSALRRSTREVSSKQPVSSTPPTTRKSERLERQFPTTPLKKKGSVLGKNISSSSSKCSEKGNDQNSYILPGSKKTDGGSTFSSLNHETDKKGTLAPASGTKTPTGNKKHSERILTMKKNRMDARVYRSLLFRPRNKSMSSDGSGDAKKTDKLSKSSKILNRDDSGEDNSGSSERNMRQEENSKEHEKSEEHQGYKSEEGSKSSGSSSEKSDKFRENSIESEGGSDLQVIEDCATDILPSSREFVAEDQGNDDAEAVQSDSLEIEAVEPSILIGSTSGILHDEDLPGIINTVKRSNGDADINPEDYEAADNKSNKMDSTSLWSSCGSEKSIFEVSSIHRKRQRVQNSPKEVEFFCCVIEKEQVLSKPSSPSGRIAGDEGDNCRSFENGMDRVQHELDCSNIEVCDTQSICCLCNGDGELLKCDGTGCGRSFHDLCIDPSFHKVVDGDWHCMWCARKKMESGPHSVSGVESVWDVKDVDVAVSEGFGKEKLYFVKYKGLSHVHNKWIRESQLPDEISVPAKTHKRNQWKHEWVVPQRLLKRRLLTPPKQFGKNECTQDDYNEHHSYEWLVKWHGLGYESVTWELENTFFLNLPDCQRLISEYSHRCEMTKLLNNHSTTKGREHAIIKLSNLPSEVSGKVENNYLLEINKLREHWHNCKNAAVFDEQDRIVRIVIFILSLKDDVTRPFMIITLLANISLWETEFSRLAPSVNAVSYTGGKTARDTIRKLEFYGDTGVVMFQVILATPESFIEDIEDLNCIGWEIVIMDECQRLKMSMYSDKLKQLVTDFRILIFSGYGKESMIEYQSYLSFIDESSDEKSSDGGKYDGAQIGLLKEKILSYLAYDYKTDNLKAVEYWVPVKFSNVQLEQYCATLLSNSIALRWCLKTEVVDAFRDILVSLYKCCDHPYIVDNSLQSMLIRELTEIDVLNIGIRASGKLCFLDSVLPVIKDKGLRALILYQSISGSVRNTIGDILDDYMRQRFGNETYERVDGGGFVPSKKQTAMNMFNNKEHGRFVFILEARACLPSIKLTSVDIVFIFNSDWNPSNDLKAFQKITIESQTEPIKIFRLYTPCTVEEKVLVLSKDTPLDYNIGNISRSVIHVLLSWCAPSLFRMLDTFHGANDTPSCENINSEKEFLDITVREFKDLLSQRGEESEMNRSSHILNVGSGERRYAKNVSLVGESEDQCGEKQPHVFWGELFEGRFPLWRFFSWPSNRSRRRVQQYVDEGTTKSEVETPTAMKKRRKVDKGKSTSTEKEGNTGDGNAECQSHLISTAFEKQTPRDMHKTPVSTTEASHVHEISSPDADGSGNARGAQKQLHIFLKPEISKLCESLHFSDAVKDMAEKFLDYIMNKRVVGRESPGILQAFQISVCWSAASLVRQKIDHNKTLSSVQQNLGFCCPQEMADSVYSKLRPLRRSFLHEFGSDNQTEPPPAVEDVVGNQPTQIADCTMSTFPEAISKNKEAISIQSCSEAQTSKQESTKMNKLSEKISVIKQNYLKQMEILQSSQDSEMEQHNKVGEIEKSQLLNQYRVELGFIHSLYSLVPTRLTKLSILEAEFADKMEKHKTSIETEIEELREKHHAAKSDLEAKEALELQELSSTTVQSGSGEEGTSNHLVHTLPVDSSPDATPHVADDATPCGDLRADDVEETEGRLLQRSNIETEQNNDDGFVILGDSVQHESNSSHEDVILDKSAMERPSCTLLDPISESRELGQTGTDQFVQSSQPCCGSPANESAPPPSDNPPSLQPSHSLTSFEPVNEDRRLPPPSRVSDEDIPNLSALLLGSGIERDVEKDNEEGSSRILETPPTDEVVPPHIVPTSDVVIQPPVSNDMGFSPSIEMPNPMQMASSSPQPVDNSASGVQCGMKYSLPLETEVRQGIEGTVSEQNFSTQLEEDDRVEERNECIQNPTACLGSHSGRNEDTVPDVGARPVGVSLDSFPFPSETRPSHPTSHDPLQNELERVGKEMKQLVKTHEDMKLVLKSDCEKEVEDTVAQIRRKYELTLQSMDERYVSEKKEMEMIHTKVLMNKILADALRYKCMDVKASGLPRIHQGYTGIPSQQRQPMFMVGQSTAPAPPPVYHHPNHHHHHHHLPLPTTQVRPPHISPVTFSSVFHGNEIRGPAPHLHPFRQPSSSSQPIPMFPPLQGHHPVLPPPPHPPPRPAAYLQNQARRHEPLGEVLAQMKETVSGSGGGPALAGGLDPWDLRDPREAGVGPRGNSLPRGAAEPVQVVYLSDDD